MKFFQTASHADGTVFKLNPDGTGFTVLASFDYSTTGTNPNAGLIQGMDGALYGTATQGGSKGPGTVFKLNRDGTGFTVLKNLDYATTGEYPNAGLIQGTDGALYGTASYGGSYDCGTVFKLNPDGTNFTVLVNFDGPTSGAYPYAGLIQGTDGALYGTAAYGGSYDYGTVFKLNPDGSAFRVLANLSLFASATVCTAGTDAPDCNDNDVCTTDSCDPATGCVHAPSDCNDNNPCTDDACDPATGLCSNPNAPDGTVCTDNDLCTTGDACRSGFCTPTLNGLDEPNPRTNGYYKRLCHGPHSGDQLTDADAACVAQVTAAFAGISTAAQICEVIEPSPPNNDKCNQTEDDLMVLALNICRARVCTAQSIDSRCGSNANVGQSLAESDAILSTPSRNFDTCSHAKCLNEEINTGGALEMNSLRLHLEAGGVRLTWQVPYQSGGSARPRVYHVWRRPLGSLPVFTRIGETTNPSFLDAASGAGAWEYEVTAVMN